MELKAFMPGMILDELADAVGGYENVSMEMSDRATYGVDYFWVGRMWQDRGAEGPKADIISLFGLILHPPIFLLLYFL